MRLYRERRKEGGLEKNESGGGGGGGGEGRNLWEVQGRVIDESVLLADTATTHTETQNSESDSLPLTESQ